MLMELLSSHSDSHFAESSPFVVRELSVPTLPHFLLDSEHLIDMHPNPNEQGLPFQLRSYEHQNRLQDYHNEDESPSMTNSSSGTVAGPPWIVPQGYQGYGSANDATLPMSYSTSCKSRSADNIYSPYSAHQSHFYSTPAVPEMSHTLSYLPTNETFNLNAAETSPIMTRVTCSNQFAPPFMMQDHSAMKKEPLEVQQKYGSHNLPQNSPPLELASSFPSSNLGEIQHYPDVTTMLNSDSSIAAPMVETTFVDLKVCTVCGKRITRDMIRHMRTHQADKRFNCMFPRDTCDHKTGQFNRRYDFKKHLLNKHFDFVNPNVKKVHNLRDKLNDWGYCPCGRQYLSGDWLENHILTGDEFRKCPIMTGNNS